MRIGRVADIAAVRQGPTSRLWICLSTLLWPWLILALPQTALAADGGFDRGLLFRVQPPGGGTPSYLFGTIHSEDSRVVHVPAPVQHAFDRSRVLALEVVPDAQASAASVAAMTFDDGRSLSDLLPAEVYHASIAALGARGLPDSVARVFKPWAVMVLLNMPEPKTGRFLDMVLYRKALAAGKPVVGVETMQEQLAVLEGLAATDQVALLRETLALLPQMPELFESLIDAYERRDLATLMTLGDSYLLSAEPVLADRFRDALLNTRNTRMAQRILPMVEQGGYFIAVGALHLPGSDGLLNRLVGAKFGIETVF